MIKEAFGVAETIEEAKEAAISELNANLDDDVMFDIIDMPKKKVLGIFGGNPAKVRAYIEIDDPAPKKAAKKPNKAKTEKPVADKKPVKQPKAEKEVKQEINAVAVSELTEDCPALKAIKYLEPVLEKLGCTNVEFKVALFENSALLILTGDGLGACIGHRGETLDALQYLSSLAANSSNGYYKISIDIGNYRERREKTLISLANKMSAQVLRTGRSRSLEPMNPYERRIIHTAVQEIEGVSSHSVGEGARRHIVITSDSPRPVKKAEPKTNENREVKKDSEALPLYGKIK
ncbi:MAG: RNA-binding cell elongation regulator Jag/EloR [Acutalibacteraceae bacterium]|nr:RNA-binding cell elongation regulator Jag/EloR [Acutalibacteraceae bacterium]